MFFTKTNTFLPMAQRDGCPLTALLDSPSPCQARHETSSNPRVFAHVPQRSRGQRFLQNHYLWHCAPRLLGARCNHLDKTVGLMTKRRGPNIPKQSRQPGNPATQRPGVTASNASATGPRLTIVLGAGVDVAYKLPTIANLARELAAFSHEDGAPIHEALRSKLPHLRFTFDKYASDKSNDFLSELFTSATDVVPTLTSAVEKLKADTTMAPVGDLIGQLCEMATNNQLSAESLRALAKLSGQNWNVGESEPILDPQRLTLTQLPGDVLRTAFREALMRGDQLNDREREVLTLFVEATSNVEQLLSTYFTLFTAGKPADQKTYLYLVWMLWAFLRSRSINRIPVENSIYSALPSIGGDIITFNYTNFFPSNLAKRVKFFHGQLDRYLRVDDRQVIADDPALLKAINISSIVSFLGGLRMDVGEPGAIDLPAIVPPTSFKPVMSREQLRTWVQVDECLQNAGVVIVVGYSFASADEHFNDLLRRSNSKSRVLVVNPDVGVPLRNVSRILGIDPESLSKSVRDGYDRFESGRLIYVVAKAEAVGSDFIASMSK